MASSLGFCLGAVVAGGHVALDDVDAEVGEQVVDAVDLVEGELDVLQGVGDVVAGQVALLATLFHEQANLFDGELGGFRRFAAVFCEIGQVCRPLAFVGLLVHRDRADRLAHRAAHCLQPYQLRALLPTFVGLRRDLEPCDEAAHVGLLQPQEELVDDSRREPLPAGSDDDLCKSLAVVVLLRGFRRGLQGIPRAFTLQSRLHDA